MTMAMEDHPNGIVSLEDTIKTVAEARPCANKPYGCECDQRHRKPGGGFYLYCCATCGKGNICKGKYHMRNTTHKVATIASTKQSQPQTQVPRVFGIEVLFDAQYAHQYSYAPSVPTHGDRPHPWGHPPIRLWGHVILWGHPRKCARSIFGYQVYHKRW